MKPAKMRAAFRPHGRIAPGCKTCFHFADCGGIEPELDLFNRDCLQAHCCRAWEISGRTDYPPCDIVCPNNPKYLEQLREVGGLSFENLPGVRQTPLTIPRYIPLVHRRYVKKVAVNWPMVALDTYEVVKLTADKDGMETVATCPATLRQMFGLSPSTSMILRGVADDRPLERYWTYRRWSGIPKRLALLGLSMVVGPNYSHFLDVPRHDNLFNRRRQLLCLGEFVEAGLNPVPHLNAAQPGDWRFWGRFLTENPSVSIVAVEFETGNRTRAEGERAVSELVNLQQSLGRRLHPLIIGGTQFLERIADAFENGSFVDSMPFMKTIHRQSMEVCSITGKSKWLSSPTAPNESLEPLLRRNLTRYSEWLDRRWMTATKAATGKVARRLPLAMAAG